MKFQIDGAVRYVGADGTLEISLPSVRYHNLEMDGKAVVLSGNKAIRMLPRPQRKALKGKKATVTVEITDEAPKAVSARDIIGEYLEKYATKSTTERYDPLELKAWIRKWAQDTRTVSRKAIGQVTGKLVMNVASAMGFEAKTEGVILKKRWVGAAVRLEGRPGTPEYQAMVRMVWLP